MTTIAYRDGIMAADMRAYDGRGDLPRGRKTKIENMSGVLVGVSSAGLGVCDAVKDWIRNGSDMSKKPEEIDGINFMAIMVYPDGTAKFFSQNWHASTTFDDFYAIGSGECLAMGALAAGASAPAENRR